MEDENQDQDLERISREIRTIRHRDTVARTAGAAVAFVFGVGLFLLTLVFYGDGLRPGLRIGAAAVGVLLGALVYRALMPKRDPADVG